MMIFMISEKIKKQALKLSEEERAELAHILIKSLPPVKKLISEEAWSEELKKRIDQYEQDNRSAKSWDEIKNNARAILGQ